MSRSGGVDDVDWSSRGPGAVLRQLGIIGLLVGALLLLHRFAVPPEGAGFDPTGLLAFGFVVLASYTIGELTMVVRLPHITGYLLAGVALGPSVAALFPYAPAPFDRGVLNPQVINQLGLMDTLAVGLIALSAGGELRLETLRSGLRAILGVLIGHFATVMLAMTLFILLISGIVPTIELPGFGGIDPLGAIALGAVVGAISFATSPAATLAILSESNAKGPMSRTVISTVVLKDVVVVVTFTIASVVASLAIGEGSADGNVLLVLAWHVLGSLGVGVGIGGLMVLYLRFVEKEVLLFLVGVVYVATYLSNAFHLDPVLLFLAAGFTVANFSAHGEAMIDSVQQLSMPVFVVFFTLAGARLHLEELAHLWPFALALVSVRAVAVFLGVGLGARIGKADPGTRRYGWMGFLSQAGVAITLAAKLGEDLGAPGRTLSTLLIAGVAINEMIGPVLLERGLILSGEVAPRNQPPSEENPSAEAPSPETTS